MLPTSPSTGFGAPASPGSAPGLPPRPPSAKVHPTGARGTGLAGRRSLRRDRRRLPDPRRPRRRLGRRAPPRASPSTSTPTPPSPTRLRRVHLLETVWFRSRIDAMARTRFERTLHLDADVLAVADLRDVFEVLDRFDIALAHDQWRNSPAANAQWRRPLPNAFPQFNGGVIAYRRTPEVLAFLAAWADALRASGLKRDQPVLRELLWESDLRIATLPPEYNLLDKVAHRPLGPLPDRPPPRPPLPLPQALHRQPARGRDPRRPPRPDGRRPPADDPRRRPPARRAARHRAAHAHRGRPRHRLPPRPGRPPRPTPPASPPFRSAASGARAPEGPADVRREAPVLYAEFDDLEIVASPRAPGTAFPSAPSSATRCTSSRPSSITTGGWASATS